MPRLIAALIGAFFTFCVMIAFTTGLVSYISEPPKPTVEAVFHKLPNEEFALQSDGVMGTFDRRQLQRGFQVYKEVCSACHSLSYVSFRDLKEIGYNDPEVKAIAAGFQVPVYSPLTGELKTRPGLATDHFPPVVYGGAGSPPNLSLIAKARHGGPAYVHSLLTGYAQQPAELLKNYPESKTPDGLFYNPYFANLNIAMPPPLAADGQVSYKDGTRATIDQMATDVSAFLVWTAEPKLEKRHQTGWPVLGFLLFACVLAYMAYRNVWADKKH
jgi:ubiquinol-cytochrome c reductase cytochrome c1 subunit